MGRNPTNKANLPRLQASKPPFKARWRGNPKGGATNGSDGARRVSTPNRLRGKTIGTLRGNKKARGRSHGRKMVVGLRFERRKAKPADLQSAPVGHFGNPPSWKTACIVPKHHTPCKPFYASPFPARSEWGKDPSYLTLYGQNRIMRCQLHPHFGRKAKERQRLWHRCLSASSRTPPSLRF